MTKRKEKCIIYTGCRIVHAVVQASMFLLQLASAMFYTQINTRLTLLLISTHIMLLLDPYL